MVRQKPSNIKKNSGAFLDFLDHWFSGLPVVTLQSLLSEYSSDQTALVSVDVVNGFCKEGNLASPRVGAIVEPVVALFETARNAGIEHYLLLQDSHPQGSKEFEVYPPHCREGSHEAKAVKELLDLSYSNQFQTILKKTIHPGQETEFREWLLKHAHLRQFIVVGDCTDICVYLLALFLKTWHVQRDLSASIIVPADCVDTYDVPVDPQSDILPHPADLLHPIFLYHMQLNGVRIVRGIR